MNNYVILPKISIEPSKACLFNQIFIRDIENESLITPQEKRSNIRKQFKNISSKNKIVRKFHNFKISDNAYRTIKRRINWLYYLSKSRYKVTYNGKKIYNFKVAFITLTLPSKQKENTNFITNNYLNQFLTEIRQRTNMTNYVWRLEFQKNGNVHYHLVTDTYIDYNLVRSIWNRILSKGGYIKDYQNKFKNLSLSEYQKLVNSDGKKDFKSIAKAYAFGKKTNWSEPNSVDVKSVYNGRSINNYLSKYFAKDSKHNTIKNELDTQENSENLRLWYCSRSLSKLKTVCDFQDVFEFDLTALFDKIKGVKMQICKYVRLYYFDFFKLPNDLKELINRLLRDYSKRQGYIAAL